MTDPHRKHTGGLDPTPPDPGSVPRGPGPVFVRLAFYVYLIGVGVAAIALDPHPAALHYAPLALLIVATWIADGLERVTPRHRPVAVALGVLAAAGVGTALLASVYPPGDGPYVGARRVAFHVKEALILISAAIPAMLALAVFPPGPVRRRYSRGLALIYAGAWPVLVYGYPEIRGETLRQAYLVAELLGLFVGVAVAGAWLIRRRRLHVERKATAERLAKGWNDCDANTGLEIEQELRDRPPAITAACVGMLLGAPLVLLGVGAWRYGLFGRAYEVQQAGLLAVYGALAVAQAFAWWRAR